MKTANPSADELHPIQERILWLAALIGMGAGVLAGSADLIGKMKWPVAASTAKWILTRVEYRVGCPSARCATGMSPGP
jgi:hypothetical protein